jgi:glycosyltransferase involved in cell wall biosynthesis
VTGLDPERYRALVVLPDHGELAASLRHAGVEVQVRPLAVLRRSLMSPRGVSRVAASWAADAGGLGRMARKHGIALVHTNTSVTLGGAAAARVAGVPHVWHVREIYAGFERWFPAYRRLLLTADALPCVSDATCEQFDADPAAFTLHDGLAVAPGRAERGAAREALGLRADAFVVAVLGRISGWKGQDVAIRALAHLPDDAVLAIAGQPWRGEERHLRELWSLARAQGVADRVVHLGFVDDVARVYGAADVIAVPSKQPDPLPNAALEAAASGCCVVASDHGGLPEILRDGETGLLVTPGDPAALAAAIAGADRERLGAAAAADVAQRFAPEITLAKVQALYDTLLS